MAVDRLSPRCEVCQEQKKSVDVVECPQCGECPLMCRQCAATKPCPNCGAEPPKPEEM